jgi:hypothetical protein
MEKITIRVIDFTEAPGPRYISQGEHSGEQFYVEVLNKKMADCIKENKELDILLDGTAGYPSSFLDQAFGELVYDFSKKIVDQRVNIVTTVNRRRKEKLENETYVQWEEKRNSKSSLKHEKKEYELFYIDKEGNLNKRNR